MENLKLCSKIRLSPSFMILLAAQCERRQFVRQDAYGAVQFRYLQYAIIDANEKRFYARRTDIH